jgi:hypothetical protein
MNARALSASACALASALFASPARSQAIGSSGAPLYPGAPSAPPPEPGAYLHDGLYVRYSIGPSYVEATGDGPSGTVTAGGPGVSEILAIGGTPGPGLVVAGAAISNLAAPTVAGTQRFVTVATYGLLVEWFPDPRTGWHLGGAAGLGFLGYGDARAYSVGGSLLAGYDFWVAAQWAVGALVTATATPRASLQNGDPGDPPSMMPAAIAIEATVISH